LSFKLSDFKFEFFACHVSRDRVTSVLTTRERLDHAASFCLFLCLILLVSIMLPSSKQPISGLRSIKRDFSSNTIPSSSQSNGDTGAKSLSGQERRLKMIQEALSGFSSSSETPASSSKSDQAGGTKRASESGQEDSAPKRRHLPSSWSAAGPAPVAQPSSKYFTTAKALSSSTPINKTLASSTPANKTLVSSGPVKADRATAASASSSTSKKAAGVFLSQEQTHILKLVENGESIFYTGSAG
jgi:hypothetical protein